MWKFKFTHKYAKNYIREQLLLHTYAAKFTYVCNDSLHTYVAKLTHVCSNSYSRM